MDALALSPLWRSWRNAGLRFLLMKDEATAKKWQLLAQQDTSTVSENSEHPEYARVARPNDSESSVATVSPAKQAIPSIRPASSASLKLKMKPLQMPEVLPQEKWSPFWQNLLKNKVPPHPKIVWTYPGLAEDFCGTPNALHRKIVATLFRGIALPAGSNALWPLSEWTPESGEKPEPDGVHFYSGIVHLKPNLVVLLCQTPPQILGLDHLLCGIPRIINGRYFVLTSLVDTLDDAKCTKLIGLLKAIPGLLN